MSQAIAIWSFKSVFEVWGVYSGLQLPQWEFTWECEGELLCIPESMWCDSRVSLLARNLATLCLGRKPKPKVATSCKTFSNNVKGVVFYGVPHVGGPQNLSNYFIWKHQQINTLSKDATPFGISKNLESFNT